MELSDRICLAARECAGIRQQGADNYTCPDPFPCRIDDPTIQRNAALANDTYWRQQDRDGDCQGDSADATSRDGTGQSLIMVGSGLH
jgi:hypothetical protein